LKAAACCTAKLLWNWCMVNKFQTAKVEKSSSINFLRKARDFFKSAKDNLEAENWNAAGLDAVHSGISANDALLACLHGVRSTSKSHDDAIGLTATLVNREGAKDALNHLRRLIAKKNLIEYEGKCFPKDEAEKVVLHAERFILWVESALG